MLTPIKLDAKAAFGAVEIEYKSVEALLTTKLGAHEPAVAQVGPEDLFFGSRVPA